MSYAYQPAHEAHLTKHNNQMFEFDSPATIAKQQQQQQFQQAGGAPSMGSVPAPPPLPQLGFKNSRPLGLRTRDWGNKPWNGQSNAYVPPPALLKNNSASSLNKFPVFIPSSNWGNRSIASTTSSPRTPSLLGVYDPDLLAGQTTHLQSSSSDHHPQASGYQSGALQSAMQSGLQSGHSGLPSTNYSPSSTIPLSHNFHLPSSQLSHSTIPTQSDIPSNLSLNKGSSIPLDSNLSLNKGSSIPLDNNLSLNKGSSIPFDNNLSLNKGSSIPSNLSLNKDSSILGGNNLSLGQNSSIPTAPAWTGYRHGAWRANRSKPNLRLRTKDWGSRSNKGWTGYNSRSILDEGFLRNRPKAAPMAPPMASLFGQRKWKSGPYRMRPLRTRNWGPRNEDGWSHFNRGIFMHESALPFMANRQRWADSEDLSRDLSRDIPQQSNLSAPIQQSNLSAPIQQSNFSAPIQQSNFSAPIQQSFSSAPISAPISAAPIVAPLAAAPLAAPIAPLTGRKGKRAARKLRKQQAIQAKLTSELTPPVGDPAVNHYRRGAKATVPLAGPAVGLANPTGSIASRRTGRRNNLGRRRNRLAAPALPVPATQPPVVALAPVAPLSTGLPLSNSLPLSAPLSATSASFVPINSAPLSSSYGSSRKTVAPAFARSAGIPLNTQQSSSSLYSSAAQQSRPLSSTFAQPIVGSNKPLYSAHEPVAAQIMEKQQPIIQNRPIGSATF